jgi:hypothetical protein
MRLFLFGVLGLSVQGAGLTAFMLVSRSGVTPLGKLAIVVITGLSICTLLWEGVRRSERIPTVCFLPLVLTFDYVLAIHLLGLLGFPGLLKDAWPPWLDYVLSVLRVTGYLLAMFGLATALFFALIRGFRRSRLRTNAQFLNL